VTGARVARHRTGPIRLRAQGGFEDARRVRQLEEIIELKEREGR
jgi:hypothetical protein